MSPHDAERMTTRYQLLFVAVELGAGTAGPRHAYEASARRIWDAVMEYRQNSDEPGPG
jgi:hypothetical protein